MKEFNNSEYFSAYDLDAFFSCIIGLDGDVVDCSDNAPSMLKVASKQNVMDEFKTFFHKTANNLKSGRTAWDEYLLECLEEGQKSFEFFLVDGEGKTLPSFCILREINYNYSPAVQAYFFNLSIIAPSQEKLQRRESMLSAIKFIAELLLAATEDNIDETINETLELIAGFANSDRCYIYRNFGDDIRRFHMTQCFEWVAPGVEHCINKGIVANPDYFEPLLATLSIGNYVHSVTKHLDDITRYLLDPQGVKAVFMAPIFVEDFFWGFIGFDNCTNERMWDDYEVELLSSCGILIASAAQRCYLIRSLKYSNERFEDIAQKCRLVLWELDENQCVSYLTEAYTEVTGFPLDECIGKHMSELSNFDEASIDVMEVFMDALNKEPYGFKFEFKPITKNGKDVWFRTYATAFRDVVGESNTGFRGYHIDITDEKIYKNQILKMAANANNASNKAQAAILKNNVYITNIGNELLEPINQIISNASLIQFNSDTKPENFELAKQIDVAASVLQRLVSDVVDTTSIEVGKIEIDNEVVSINEIIATVLDLTSELAKDKCISLVNTIHPNVPQYVYSDTYRLTQVLEILIDNAIKFTEEGEISLECFATDLLIDNTSQIIFKISDTGVGMSDDMLASLFDAHHQDSMDFFNTYSGGGLGLTIARNLLDLMGGRIDVVSELGKGSVFTVTIPMKIEKDTNKIKQAIVPIDTSDKQPIILLVEDNELNREVISTILDDYGMLVDAVSDGKTAIDKVSHKIYDLILMDIKMEGMDGLDTTRRIRALPATQNIPILALTAYTRKSDIIHSIEAGMNEHISKPIRPPDLIRTITKWLDIAKK
ncbi:MAG: response regulator [Ignavibacteria bacterium]|jgi:PAS domain S-box-containing protein|nr:response regulator [Ignavibacteria bacterium]